MAGREQCFDTLVRRVKTARLVMSPLSVISPASIEGGSEQQSAGGMC